MEPGEERVIGARAPFETDARHAPQYIHRALQDGPAKLQQALQVEREVLAHGKPQGPAPTQTRCAVLVICSERGPYEQGFGCRGFCIGDWGRQCDGLTMLLLRFQLPVSNAWSAGRAGVRCRTPDARELSHSAMASLVQRASHMTDLLPEADLTHFLATVARGDLKLAAPGGRGLVGKAEQQQVSHE